MSSSRLKSRRRQDQGSKYSRIVIAILATIGVIDTGSITLNRWGIIGDLTCPGGTNGCNQVLSSPWGTLFENSYLDIPLSAAGFLSYILLLILAILPFISSSYEKRVNFIRVNWWGLFITSCSMSIFSILLLGIMFFKIKAFCFFCLLSAFISVSILILVILGGNWEDSRDLIFKGTLLSLVVLIMGLMWSSSVDPEKNKSSILLGTNSPPIVKNISTKDSISLAKFLTKQNISLYNAYWCPHCHDQKEMFGREAVLELNLIECAPDGENSQTEVCQEKEITAFPSWEIKGEIISGVRTLNELAELSEYKGSKNFK